MEKRPFFRRSRFVLLAIVLAVVTLGLIARMANAYPTRGAMDVANPASPAGSLEARSSSAGFSVAWSSP